MPILTKVNKTPETQRALRKLPRESPHSRLKGPSMCPSGPSKSRTKLGKIWGSSKKWRIPRIKLIEWSMRRFLWIERTFPLTGAEIWWRMVPRASRKIKFISPHAPKYNSSRPTTTLRITYLRTSRANPTSPAPARNTYPQSSTTPPSSTRKKHTTPNSKTSSSSNPISMTTFKSNPCYPHPHTPKNRTAQCVAHSSWYRQGSTGCWVRKNKCPYWASWKNTPATPDAEGDDNN